MFVFFCILILLYVLFVLSLFLIKPCKSSYNASYESTEYASYKIGAEVGEVFYYEVKRYCSNKRITISELIRKSVKAYMENNK